MIVELFGGYVDFATENGTVNDGSSRLLLGGAVLISLLTLYALYNLVLAIANGIHRTGRASLRVAGLAGLRPVAVNRPGGRVAAAMPAPRAGSPRPARAPVKVG